MRRSALFACALGCASSAPAPSPNTPATAGPCDKLDVATSGSGEMISCARQALDRRDHTTVTTIADAAIQRFPYSLIASQAEELKADILFLRRQFAEAAAAYRALVLVASGARIEELRTKQEAAEAKASTPAK